MSVKSDDDTSLSGGSSFRSAASSRGSQLSNRSSSSFQNNNVHSSTSLDNHDQDKCSRHCLSLSPCFCIRSFYEDDEVCRKNAHGNLEFGIVSRYENTSDLKVFWTLDNEIEEQDLDYNNPQKHDNLRLIDRKLEPGDTVHCGRKRGEVLDVSWLCYLRILDNGMGLLDIPCERLEPLLPYYPGQRIEMNGWIGTIQSISTEANLMFPGGKTAIVDCQGLPKDQQPYPGSRVKYSFDELNEAGLDHIDGETLPQIFNEDPVEAFVLFLNISAVGVAWNGRITGYPNSPAAPSMPNNYLSRSQLKKHVKILGMQRDVDWDSNPEVVDRLYNYTVRPTDTLITDSRTGIENHMVAKYFNNSEHDQSTKSLEALQRDELVGNVSYIVRVLRFGRVLRVKWARSGKVERIRASRITSKHSFQQPFRQLVQRKISLCPYTQDEYGVTLTRDTNDTVSVQWLGKDSLDSSSFRMIAQTSESTYDLEPHFVYGSIKPKEIVYRSAHCRLPDPLFTVGWVRQITLQGQIIVVSLQTKQEHSVFPTEIDTTGMKINSDVSEHKIGRPSVDMIRLHGLSILRMADQYFTMNVNKLMDWTCAVPQSQHFKLVTKAPTTHAFYQNQFAARADGHWFRAVRNDQITLNTQANETLGTVWIKGFGDRLDLFSVLMAAPVGTPYEGGLYTFDVQLPYEYPIAPPSVYLTTVLSPSSKIRPGIHSLELVDAVPPHSLVESLMTLQAKLFSSSSESLELPSSAASLHRREFSLNEKQESRTNAQILIDTLDLMFRMAMDPPKLWSEEVIRHFHMTFPRSKSRLTDLIELREDPYSKPSSEWAIPHYPLLPLSDGFVDAVINRIKRFEQLLQRKS
ncbi:E2/E3 hybrid ubiquitin-protein ligase UBE2O [Orchesella cincta]|uniref:E2/E3 hybrid ubiquitin-protein ligase UBE2O n=1 Tax=Orchesella cincta TaxID=48709 RepID=A0A1D2ML92_ORCCI|nr:E2/E3 hybrid ubiquitin-protein ligase UBE2O [Orchesella cincta]